jgi:hypothetical protein
MDRDATALDPELLAGLRALVDQHRLRIVGRAAASPVDAETLAAELRLPLPQVRRHLEVLLASGLVEVRGGTERRERFAARLDRVGGMGRGLAALERSAHGVVDVPGGAWPHEGEPLADTLARLEATPDELRTLRAYLVDGRLTTMPAQPKKRDIVLRFLLERVFTEDREYPEKEVNQRLALFHPDVAALRRYLYDAGLVDRDHGLYRRSRPRGCFAGRGCERPGPAGPIRRSRPRA